MKDTINNQKPKDNPDKPEEQTEITSMRTRDCRFFKNPGGTMTAEVRLNISIPDIQDNTLVLSNDPAPSYENKSHRFKVKFPKQPKNQIFSLTLGNKEIGFDLADMDSLNNKADGQVHGDTIHYSDLLPSIDFEYKTLPNGVKESVFIKSEPKTDHILFAINAAGLKWSQKSDGSIIFSLDEDSPLFHIHPVSAVDASGKTISSINQKVKQDQDGLIMDVSWDKSELQTCVYPIIIDPTIIIQPAADEGMDTYVYTGYQPTDPLPGSDYQMTIGAYDSSRALIKFPLSSIPRGTIQSATMYLYTVPISGNQVTVAASAYQITQEWLAGEANWYYAKSNQAWMQEGGTYTGSPVGAYGTTGGILSFDLTSLVNSWVNGSYPNYGVILISGATPTFQVYTSEFGTDIYRPRLDITYIPDTVSPTVSIASPTHGANISGTVNFSANVSDASGIKRVEFYAGDILVGSKNGEPFQINWDTMRNPDGPCSIWVDAYDKAGNVSTSSAYSVNIINGNGVAAPRSLIAQSDANGNISLTWNASATPGITYRVYRSIAPGFSISTPQTSFVRSSTAYTLEGTQVAGGSPRYESAAFNTGLIIEEGTTNLLTSNQSSIETDLTGISSYGTGTVLTRDTSQAWSGNASLKVETPNLVYSGPAFNYNTSNQGAYIGQLMLRGAGMVNVYLRIAYTDSTYDQVYSTCTITNQWTRVVTPSLTSNPAKTVSYVQIAPRTNTAQITTFWVDGVQIEQKAYATSWQVGGTARTAETLTIPTANVFNKGNWAIEMAYKPSVNANSTYRYLWTLLIDSANYYRLRVDSATGKLWLTIASNGVYKNIIYDMVLQKDTQYKIMAAGDGSHIRLCVNGQQVGSDLAYSEPIGQLPLNMYIGSAQTNTYQANGIYDDLRISNRARTVAEHQAAYNSGQPLPVDAATTYKLNLDGNMTAETAFPPQ